jgi:hypothetical protein
LPECDVVVFFYGHDMMWGKCEGVEGFVFVYECWNWSV